MATRKRITKAQAVRYRNGSRARPGLHRAHRKIRHVGSAPGRSHHPTRLVTVLCVLFVGVGVAVAVAVAVVGSMSASSNSSTACQPSAHWCIRSTRALRTRRAPGLPGRPTRHDHRGRLAGHPVHQPASQRAHAHALLQRQPSDHGLVSLQRAARPPAGPLVAGEPRRSGLPPRARRCSPRRVARSARRSTRTARPLGRGCSARSGPRTVAGCGQPELRQVEAQGAPSSRGSGCQPGPTRE